MAQISSGAVQTNRQKAYRHTETTSVCGFRDKLTFYFIGSYSCVNYNSNQEQRVRTCLVKMFSWQTCVALVLPQFD